MSNCEIVDNVACGVSFQYCRTHKVEPKDCPGNNTPEDFELLPYTIHTYQVELVRDNEVTKRPEFKAGDRVRALESSAFSIKKGEIYEVIDTYIGVGGPRVRFKNPRALGGTDGWLVKYFELVS